jgi:hypothetical protein
MELAGDRPTDQIAFFLDPEAFQSSIGSRDQCLGRFPFVFGCAKDRTERKRPPSPELRSAWRRWLCAAWWNTLLRRTGHLFELPAAKATITTSRIAYRFLPPHSSSASRFTAGAFGYHQANDEPERTKMRDRLAREWPPIPPRRGMQSIGGRWTSSPQRQSQEPSQPQHSRTNKFSFQGPSCWSPPKTQPSIIYTKGQPPSLFILSFRQSS